MLNYDEIVTQARDHRTLLLTNAEQQRLAQALAPVQAHPVVTWLGRQWVGWGRQLQGAKPLSTLPVPPVTEVAKA